MAPDSKPGERDERLEGSFPSPSANREKTVQRKINPIGDGSGLENRRA